MREKRGVYGVAKTKIECFEEELTKTGVTNEKLREYEKLLKRAGNDWSRIQHCYFTAYWLPVERLEESIKLIEFGIARYGSEPGYAVHAYDMLGMIYERAGCYQKAYEIYTSIFPNHIGGYRGSYPWCLLNMKMHTDGFRYSEKLEAYFELCLSENEFSRSALNNQFMLAVADYIIADYYDDEKRRNNAYDDICKMLEPGFKGALFDILKKHGHEEQLKLTKECRTFLNGIKR